MKFTINYFLPIALVGMVAAATIPSVFAADQPTTPMEKVTTEAPDFREYDANADDKISLQEFQAQKGDEQTLREADIDKNSSLTREEFLKIK